MFKVLDYQTREELASYSTFKEAHDFADKQEQPCVITKTELVYSTMTLGKLRG